MIILRAIVVSLVNVFEICVIVMIDVLQLKLVLFWFF